MSKITKILALTATLGAHAFLSKVVIDFYLADAFNTKAKKYLYAGQVEMAYSCISDSIARNPFEPSYRRTKATILIAETTIGLGAEVQSYVKEAALSELNTAYQLQSHNMVNIKSLIPLYFFLSVNDISDLENSVIDQKYKAAAIKFYGSVENESPNDASFLLALGKQYRALRVYDRAKEMLAKALVLKPDLSEAKEELNLLNLD